MFLSLHCALFLVIPAGSSAAESRPAPVPVKLPAAERTPQLPRAGEATPGPVKRRFFGLGVGFHTRGGTQGIALDQVVADSPADRAGLSAGTVITEINGVNVSGRSGEECTRLVREAGASVTLKFLDPATLKPRTRTLEKDWFLLPN